MKYYNMKYYNKFKKRCISALLAASIAAGAAAGFGAAAVSAAVFIPAALSIDLKHALTLTGGSDIPLTVTKANTGDPLADQALAYWDFSSVQSLPVAAYTLEYPIADGLRAVVTVQRDNDRARVFFDVQKYAGGAWASAPVDNSANYFIYQYLSGGAAPVITNIKTYFATATTDAAGVFTPPKGAVNYVVPADANRAVIPGFAASNPAQINALRPSFAIAKGGGFGFQYYKNDMYFRWDANNLFYFGAGGVSRGLVTPFTLTTADDLLGNYGAALTQYVCTGLSGLRFTPTANGSVTDGSGGKTADLADAIAIDNADNIFPGQPDAGLSITYDLPRVWNGATNAFDQNPAALDAIITLITDDPDQNVTVGATYTDSASSAAVDAAPAPPPDAAAAYSAGDNTVTVTLAHLPPGVIYSPSSNIIAQGTTAATYTAGGVTKRYDIGTMNTYIPEYAAYTLLPYTITQVSGRYYARISPYPNHQGDYLLMAGYGSNLSESALVTAPASPTPPAVYIPVGGMFNTFRVIFGPGISLGDGLLPGLKLIGSQYALYDVSTAPPLSLGTPGFFNIVKTGPDAYALVPNSNLLSGSLESDSTNLYATLKWDVADAGLIDSLMAASTEPGGAVSADYRLNSSLTPNNPNPALTDIAIRLKLYKDAAGTVYVSCSDPAFDPAAPGADAADPAQNKVVPGQNGMVLQRYNDPDTGKPRYSASVEIQALAYGSSSAAPGAAAADFRYPNIYYLNLTPARYTQDGGGTWTLLGAGPSVYDSMTLSDVSKMAVPPPQNLKVSNMTDPNGAVVPDIRTVTAYDANNNAATTRVSFTAQWDIPDSALRNYLKNNTVLPAGWDASNIAVTQNVYISRSQSAMASFSQYASLDDRRARSTAVALPGAATNTSLITPPVRQLYFSKMAGNEPLVVLDPAGNPISTPAIDLLRGGGVLRLEGLPVIPQGGSYALTPSLIFDGLDKNTTYYLCADIAVTYSGPGASGPVNLTEVSYASNLISATTKGDPSIPGGADKVPSAPALAQKDVGLNSATIYWLPIPDASKNAETQYEIIRTSGAQLTDEQLAVSGDFNTVWGRISDAPGALGLRTGGPLTALTLNQFQNGNFDAPYPADKYTAAYDPDKGGINLTDLTLTPNRLYFYYVRAVSVVKDAGGNPVKELYSGWSAVSVTTTPVKPPINLTVDTSRTDYDPRREAVVTFDAPIAVLSSLGTDYTLQISVRPDSSVATGSGSDSGWGEDVTMDAKTLAASAVSAALPGYYHFTYKLTGLIPGAGYSVRVRMVDSNGQPSMYSNTARFRTDTDQDAYDRQRLQDQWSGYLTDLAGQILTGPYWPVVNTASDFQAVFRPDYFDAVTDAAAGSMISFPSGLGGSWSGIWGAGGGALAGVSGSSGPYSPDYGSPGYPQNAMADTWGIGGADWYGAGGSALSASGAKSGADLAYSGGGFGGTASYYIPAQSFIDMVQAGKGFTVTRGNVQTSVPANALDPENNADLTAAIAGTAGLNGKTVSAPNSAYSADFFVKLSLSWADMGGLIDGKPAASPQTNIEFSIVRTSQNIAEWDRRQAASVKNLLAGAPSLAYYKNSIAGLIASGISDIEMSANVRRMAAELASYGLSQVNGSLGGITGGASPILKYDAPVRIAVFNTPRDAVIYGYHAQGGQWLNMDVTEWGGGKAVSAVQNGLYAFTRVTVNIAGLNSMPNAAAITGIVAQYALTDYFGSGARTSDAATRFMVLGSVARVAGAPKAADPLPWLRQKGIAPNIRSSSGNITMQEAAYAVMCLYQAKTGVDVSRLRIHNLNATRGMALSEQYKQHVRAAFETGVVTGQFNPASAATVGDVLNMLAGAVRG